LDGPSDTYNGEFVEWPGGLDVLEGLLEVAEFSLNLALGLLSALDSLGLEGINGLQLTGDIVGGGLEGLEVVLDLVDDSLVLQDAAVVGEVDLLGLLGEELNLAAGLIVTLLEGLQGGGGLAAEAERAGDLDPVDLESGATLFTGRLAIQFCSQSAETRWSSSWVHTAAILSGEVERGWCKKADVQSWTLFGNLRKVWNGISIT
jgi:hypothetical protein